MINHPYLFVMVGFIFSVAVVCTPLLIFRKCPTCGRRSVIDARACRHCGSEFPRET